MCPWESMLTQQNNSWDDRMPDSQDACLETCFMKHTSPSSKVCGGQGLQTTVCKPSNAHIQGVCGHGESSISEVGYFGLLDIVNSDRL